MQGRLIKRSKLLKYAYMENDTEYKNLVDVIGKHSTYDAVATLYGGYFDEGTFSRSIAEKLSLCICMMGRMWTLLSKN